MPRDINIPSSAPDPKEASESDGRIANLEWQLKASTNNLRRAPMMDELCERAVTRFCRQYLQLESHLDYPPDSYLRQPQVQEAIYSRLFEDGAIRYGPPTRYEVKTLKTLVSRIEGSIDNWDEHEVSENLMSALSAKLATPLPPKASSVQQKCYVTYYHPSAPSDADAQPLENAGYNHITLLESRSLISAGGTTGLRTWEAALHLGRFLCAHPDIVRGRHILELGAGTGYLSILCARHLEAAHVIASDGSDDVLYNLPDNLFLNELEHTSSAAITSQEQVSVPHESQATYGTVTLMDIKWGYALLGTEEEKWNGGRPVDVVLGADVTYDRSVIPSLVGTVLELFALYPQVEVYISATQRNRDTFQVFLDVCQGHGLKVDDFEFKVPAKEDQEGPFYSDEVEIRICRVSQSKKR